MSSTTYRVTPAPIATRSTLALAKRYERIEDAVTDMGEGVVIADDGSVIAFHERHLALIERMATVRVLIRKDTALSAEYPWSYTVEHSPAQPDALDYGSTATLTEAIEAACWALTHEEECR